MRQTWCWTMAIALVACSSSSSSGSFAERAAAAQRRTAQATCSCLLSDDLRKACLADLESAPSGCSEGQARELEERQPDYSACIIDMLERQARCLEEANCDPDASKCADDVFQACGPLPKLTDDLLVCLPTFRCSTGQEVTLDRRCDGVEDCFDASDEAKCD